MRRLACPRCTQTLQVPEGIRPVCPRCGFGATAPSNGILRPNWVTFAGLGTAARAILGVFIGLWVIHGGLELAEKGSGAGFFDGLSGIFGVLLAAFGFLVLLVNLVAVMAGVLVLRGRRWARILVIVFVCLALVMDSLFLFSILLEGAWLWLAVLALIVTFDAMIVVALGKARSRLFFGLR